MTVVLETDGRPADAGRRPYRLLSAILWPAIFVIGLTGAGIAFHTSMPLLWFNVVYLVVVGLIAFFERLIPYERTWLAGDGETFNDVAHTLLNKGGVQIAAAIGTSAPMAVATVAKPLFTPPSWLCRMIGRLSCRS